MEEGKLVVDSECKMKDSKPDECINNDFPQLSDEKFDFDLSLSPSSENEDEVFVGPMSHKEKCIAVAVEACVGAGGSIPPSSAVNLKWSPLAGEKFAEIVKEAHLVALQLQSGSKTKKKHANQVADQRPESVEKFVQESKSKLKTFETSIKTERTPRAVKRETYCVWESPISQLPHSFQKHSRQPVEEPERKSTYSPSSRRHLKSLGSLEDLLSSKSSIVPDAKVCPLVQDKRRLPTPGKLSMKTIQLKPSNDVQMRRNTLSSSSSSRSSMNSSLNSSLSISPKKGKVKTNIVAKASTCGSEVSSGTTKAAMVRSMKLSSVQASHSDLPGKQEKSTCAAKGSPSVNVAKCKADFESKISVSGIQRMSLDPRLHKSAQKMQEGRGRSCSENKMGFTTKEGMSSENGAVRVLQPIAFLSGGNVGSKVASSPPVKQLEEQTVLKSCSSIKPILTPASIKRSGLPTPVGRRMSGIPARTPKTVPRSIASPNLLPVRQASRVLSKKTSEASSKRAKESNVQAAHSSSTSSTEGDEFPPQAVAVALDFSPEKSPSHKQDLAENQKPAEETQRKEGLLVDVEIDTPPAACQECENKPLIDFFNTPEIIKTLPLKPKEKLQDLGFPLIYFSPEGNKENLDSPLIKF
ncbi:G2 and S phase-expressed protein 1 isoform X2 [Sphaerodactylus townsendi]|uniref:G2 and S phase-expressed protein 1 isoform X2 n=1 Tax=Sphaerodactylus townsendi TaxID=933632 RepID=UPI002026E08D|nr:G2 and S phase-expressed protein 1 isoform X2 [Sphaerodactylus townsendi]